MCSRYIRFMPIFNLSAVLLSLSMESVSKDHFLYKILKIIALVVLMFVQKFTIKVPVPGLADSPRLWLANVIIISTRVLYEGITVLVQVNMDYLIRDMDKRGWGRTTLLTPSWFVNVSMWKTLHIEKVSKQSSITIPKYNCSTYKRARIGISLHISGIHRNIGMLQLHSWVSQFYW